MNNFELFKLKKAGLTNQHLLNLLDYRKKHDEKLSLKNIAVISGVKIPSQFIQAYKALDHQKLKKSFYQFPTLSILDDHYPEALKNSHNPPVLLFYQGNIELLSHPKIAVVGARMASQKGIKIVRKIISELGNRFVIVSGLAKGIDTAAHLSILKNGGKTIAVIGTGLDVYYPKENELLQEYLAKNHLIISEYEPKTQPLRYHFPKRNRIIAGLSQGVIVIEAKLRSGSLITCERAMEEGRDVFAVPGNILDGKSEGCHRLIKEGAKCITSGLDVILEYQN
ncbi:DNA-processing protein DprA [Streptococcus sp. CSL10205-OR2]|uniref:DNA-processing protein DprA n=1 Tax=Streptococcus sp. CSL10205-OR2 TaxID=2980558 RepID=UPI0021DA296A|nr:DNA-processing protein DprA [Streptococcus sp. CSL10205-OR2]MCU9533237.1 DNA-processing protein DprA [Streptococcus sp. CSL10205-OR2]